MKIRKDRDSSILKRFLELFLLSTAEVLLGNCQCGGPFGFHHHENGPEIKPHTIPFHVSLITDKKKPIPFCSASLISPNYVLTTARCIIGRSISSFFLSLFLYFSLSFSLVFSLFVFLSLFRSSSFCPSHFLTLSFTTFELGIF